MMVVERAVGEHLDWDVVIHSERCVDVWSQDKVYWSALDLLING